MGRHPTFLTRCLLISTQYQLQHKPGVYVCDAAGWKSVSLILKIMFIFSDTFFLPQIASASCAFFICENRIVNHLEQVTAQRIENLAHIFHCEKAHRPQHLLMRRFATKPLNCLSEIVHPVSGLFSSDLK